MSKIRVAVSIDVTKIDKARLYKGAKGTYCNTSILINLDEEDQYGNCGFIAESVSKEERESGTQGTILGNAKIIWREDSEGQPQRQQPQPHAQQRTQAAQAAHDEEDIPF
jgi:hypothetical protein